MSNDRQLRQWLCILYPEKEERHKDFIEMIKHAFYDYCFINHIEKVDEKGEIINQAHTHCIIWFPSGIRKETIKNKFNLIDEDMHLFKGLDEFKKSNGQRMFKTIDNYIDYLSHNGNKDKPDKYSFEDYDTNRPEQVKNALESNDRTDYETFNVLYFWLKKEFENNKDLKFSSKSDIYEYCCNNGYGHLYYKYWSKINYFLDDFIVNIG